MSQHRSHEGEREVCPLHGLDDAAASAALRAFVDGSQDALARGRWERHLEGECPRCEALFASPDADLALGALTQRVEASLPAPRPGELAAAYGRIEETLGLGPRAAPARMPWWRALWLRPVLGLGVAVAVIVPVTFILPGDEPGVPPATRTDTPSGPGWRDKSAGTMAPPTLRLFHGRIVDDGVGGRRPQVVGELGEFPSVPLQHAVLFRVAVAQPCDIRLVVLHPEKCIGQRCDAARQEVLVDARLAAGEHELAAGGMALGYLADRAGTLRFRLAAGRDAAAAQEAALRSPGASLESGGAAVDRIVHIIGNRPDFR